ncbi:MAG: Bax inhibitor-1/YccA family protein [Defluviitaleaceae bacterium]|nr:Bax inhibitor-1/YccA family protein [Defluviitaleaceae bacterium]
MWNDNGFNEESNHDSVWGSVGELHEAFATCMANVFFRMFAALMVTTISALLVVASAELQYLVYGNNVVFYVLLFSPIALVLAISFGINKMPVMLANVLFFVYAFLVGLTLSTIFFVYDLGIIATAFGVTAVTFGVMAGYGLVTKNDLTSIGSLCIMGLIGIIIASIANFFIRSSAIEWAVTYIGVFVFIGLTAYDAQRIKNMLKEAKAANQEEAIKKITVIGALTLYLDFINLFLKILRILGRRR